MNTVVKYQYHSPLTKFHPGIISFSADVSKKELLRIIESKVFPVGTIFKLDRAFLDVHSKKIIATCQEHGYPVFCDIKIIEVPSKCLAIAEPYLQYHPFMLNIMAGACSTGLLPSTDHSIEQVDALKRFSDLCVQYDTRSCVVTVLTSKSEEIVHREFGVDSITQVLRYVEMAERCGITDIVCSPREVATIRSHGVFKIDLNTPGVRPAGSSVNDQARIATPGQAIKDGANRLVIGRPLLAGDGDVVERIARNYGPIRAEIEQAITEMNVAS